MPFKVVKRGPTFAIVKQLPQGKTKTVGHSKTRRDAKISARIREEASKKKNK